MLQIGAPNQLPMAPTAGMPGPGPTQTTPDPKGPPTRTPKYAAEKVPQDSARYFPPDCRCKNCDFYNQDDSSCHVVDGKVDPEGICALHTCAEDKPDDGSDAGSEPPVSSDAAAEEPPDA